MITVRGICKNTYFLGASTRKPNLFENVFPIPKGVSYNSYLISDTKTALLDTADASVAPQFLENLEYLLKDKTLDYLIINHMEPDHCSLIGEVTARYPEVKIVGNAKTFSMMKNFFHRDFSKNAVIVKEGDTLSLGKHNLKFVLAPMVHWPEAMVTFDEETGVLFSADAFGTFGALNGNIFADEVDFSKVYLDEARRYYSNIVGKFGGPVTMLLKKASTLSINMICPLHGPIFRENLAYIIEKYKKWASYTPEENAVVIIYGSMYGNTESACDALASELSKNGVRNIAEYDVSSTDVSYLIGEIFRASTIVIASPTYNGEIYPPIEELLLHMKNLSVQKRKVAVIENGSWAPAAGRKIVEKLDGMKEMTIINDTLSINSSMCADDCITLKELADKITKAMDL